MQLEVHECEGLEKKMTQNKGVKKNIEYERGNVY